VSRQVKSSPHGRQLRLFILDRLAMRENRSPPDSREMADRQPERHNLAELAENAFT